MRVPIASDMCMHPVDPRQPTGWGRHSIAWHRVHESLVCLSKPARRDAWLKCSSPTLPCHAECCAKCRRIIMISLCPRGRPDTLHPNHSAPAHTGVRPSSTKRSTPGISATWPLESRLRAGWQKTGCRGLSASRWVTRSLRHAVALPLLCREVHVQ